MFCPCFLFIFIHLYFALHLVTVLIYDLVYCVSDCFVIFLYPSWTAQAPLGWAHLHSLPNRLKRQQRVSGKDNAIAIGRVRPSVRSFVSTHYL